MKKKLSIFLLLLSTTLISCIKQEVERQSPLELKLKSSWATGSKVAQDQTRATLLPIPSGTTLGVRLQDQSQTTVNSYISYTAAADGSVAATNLEQTPKLLESSSYDLSIYSPYRPDATTQSTFNHGEDVMWTATTSGLKSGVVVEKTLSHMMSQINMDIIHAEDMPQSLKDNFPLTSAAIELTGFYDNCTMDLATGVITHGTTNNAKVTKFGQAVCFVPFAKGEVNLKIKLTLVGLDGTTKVLEGKINETIETGISSKVTVKLEEESITNGTIYIDVTVQEWQIGEKQWVDGGETSINTQNI